VVISVNFIIFCHFCDFCEFCKGVVSYFLWRVIFRVLANRGRFCFVIRLTWGFWGRRCRLWHFWIVLGTFSCPKWLNFSPIPAQAAKIPNLWPLLLCNTANMGFFGVEMPIMTLLNRFRHVLYPYPCPKWLNFSPIPAKAKIPNLRPILLCNMANMGLLWVGMPIMT